MAVKLKVEFANLNKKFTLNTFRKANSALPIAGRFSGPIAIVKFDCKETSSEIASCFI